MKAMNRVRREALSLVGLVLAVDLVFVALYFLTHLERASDGAKVAFTGVWTLLTLAVVLRGLTRIRVSRTPRGEAGPR